MDREPLTADRLRELFSYDPETGVFARNGGKNRRAKRKVGSISTGGYIQIEIDRVGYKASRLAVLYMTGEWPSDDIDHKNRDVVDNRWANLRPATHAENMQNRKMSCTNTSGYAGVSWHKGHGRRRGRWCAQISVGNKKVSLGSFRHPEIAALAYQFAKMEFHLFHPIAAVA